MSLGRVINNIDTNERDFSSITVVNTSEEYASYTYFGDFLRIPRNSCVITKTVADFNNLSVGDTIYIPAENNSALGQNMTTPLSLSPTMRTWQNARRKPSTSRIVRSIRSMIT
ncbi:MAG: hypothetical protein RBG13Loki_3672 [Promethearchaeota archaeon CR_4]|nr:MAG: hypothetical protein RBG13Loki_3672 [Candidatus Lokiarchaeota archaeon CR_4]